MSKFLNLGLEEAGEEGLADPEGKPDELEKADQMVQGEESTDPATVVKIANYKEELATLKEQQGTDDDSGDSGEDTGSTDDQGGTGETADGEAGDAPTDDTSAEEEGDETDGDDDSDSVAAEPAPDASEAGEGMDESDAKQVTEAVENFALVKKLHAVVDLSQSRNSLSQPAMEIINLSLENIRNRLGVHEMRSFQIPAMENIASFTNRQKYTDALTLSLENIAMDILNTIKKMFKAILNWVSDYLLGGKKTLAAGRADLKKSTEAHKKLIKGLEKKAELEKKSPDGAISNTPPLFKNKKAYALLVPDAPGQNLENDLGVSFERFDAVILSQLYKLSDFIGKISPVIDSVFKTQEVSELAKIDQELLIKNLFDTNGMKATTNAPGVFTQGYDVYVTDWMPLAQAFYVKTIESSVNTSTDMDSFKNQEYGVLKNDQVNVDLELPLISSVKYADTVLKALTTFTNHQTGIVAQITYIEKVLEEVSRRLDDKSTLQNVNSVEMMRLLKLIYFLMNGFALKGFIILRNSVKSYCDLLTDYHAQSVKEYQSA